MERVREIIIGECKIKNQSKRKQNRRKLSKNKRNQSITQEDHKGPVERKKIRSDFIFVWLRECGAEREKSVRMGKI